MSEFGKTNVSYHALIAGEFSGTYVLPNGDEAFKLHGDQIQELIRRKVEKEMLVEFKTVGHFPRIVIHYWHDTQIATEGRMVSYSGHFISDVQGESEM